MKDNKGMTIVEILISVCIISLVLTLLFSLLLQVKNEENSNSVQSNFLLNQSTFITQIEEDIVNYGVKAVAPCQINATGDITTGDLNILGDNNYKCVKIYYASDYIKDNIGIVQIYNYYQKYDVDPNTGKISADTDSAAWSIRYQRGSYSKCEHNSPVATTWSFGGGRVMKDMPSEIDLSDDPYVLYTAYQGKKNAASLVIPIANLDGEHYDINLSFTFDQPNAAAGVSNSGFICSKENGALDCRCEGNETLCKNTIIESDADSSNLELIRKLNSYQCP